MFSNRIQIRVSGSSNAITVCSSILQTREEGHGIALVYIGQAALSQAVKAVRKANDTIGGSSPALLIYPQMERRTLDEGNVEWFCGLLFLLTRESGYAQDQEQRTNVEAGKNVVEEG